MGQLNIYTDAKFEKKLKKYMRERGFKSKSSALRNAFEESIQNLEKKKNSSFKSWLDFDPKTPFVSNPRLKTEDDLWEKK